MKVNEITSTIIKSDYIKKIEETETLSNKYENYLPDVNLHLEITLNEIIKVVNMYNDNETFYRTLRKGEGSASPYKDSLIVLKVKLEVDGEIKFCHQEPTALKGKVGENEFQAAYDLEEYKLPAIMRKILRTTKRFEIV
jgi:hypothetical protein